MAKGDNQTAKTGLFFGISATVLAAVAAFKSGAKTVVSQAVGLGPEVMELLEALVARAISLDMKLDNILDAIKGVKPGTSPAIPLGFPPNADTFIAQFVECTQIAPASFRLPNVQVPEGMVIQLLARNPAGANATPVMVSWTEPNAGNNRQSWPMVPGAVFGLQLKNTNAIYVSAQTIGDGIYFAVEQNNH